MGTLDIILINLRIAKRGIDFAVSKQYLHLFYRHALVYGLRSQGTSELVRMHVFDARIVAEFAESGFNSADFQPFEGTMQGNEQGGLVIHSLFKVYEQMSFRTGIEVDSSFLVSFAVDHTFACIEVDITTIQLHQLAYPDARRRQ